MKKWHYILLSLLGLATLLVFTPGGRKLAMDVYNTLTDTGLRLLKQFEGFRNNVYQDAVGYWTIGYGHLVKTTDPYHPYGPVKTISNAEADELLRQDTNEAQDAVRSMVTVPLNSNQFDALTSLVYNIGRGNFSRSPVLQLLNQGNYQGAAKAFGNHVYAKGQVLEGLISRRNHEIGVFLS